MLENRVRVRNDIDRVSLIITVELQWLEHLWDDEN